MRVLSPLKEGLLPKPRHLHAALRNVDQKFVAFLHLSKEGDLFDQLIEGDQRPNEIMVIGVHHITGIP
jgi:hypothetical protein